MSGAAPSIERLTLFDLDNTLLGGDSDYGWAQFLIEQGVVNGEDYERRNAAFFADYKAGRLDIHAFLEFQMRPLADNERSALLAWHASSPKKSGRCCCPRAGNWSTSGSPRAT